VNIVNYRKSFANKNGFSLLEVMIAVGILAVALLALMDLQSTAVISSGRAQATGMAGSLARLKMARLIIDLEAEMDKGSLPDERAEQGDFAEEGYPDYRWEMQLRAVEVPEIPLPEEAASDIITRIIETITKQISKATRELKLTVFWKELEGENSIDVVTHLVQVKGKK
jgi:prepilin-type N-terminal cleavage/methylation domain-containing protein